MHKCAGQCLLRDDYSHPCTVGLYNTIHTRKYYNLYSVWNWLFLIKPIYQDSNCNCGLFQEEQLAVAVWKFFNLNYRSGGTIRTMKLCQRVKLPGKATNDERDGNIKCNNLHNSNHINWKLPVQALNQSTSENFDYGMDLILTVILGYRFQF